MRRVLSFVGLTGHTFVRVAVMRDDEGFLSFRSIDGTILPTLPESAISVSHLRWSQEQRELTTGKRSFVLTGTTVGFEAHAWKEATSVDEFVRTSEKRFKMRPTLIAEIRAFLAETYGVEKAA